jgi:hypothetical protein
MTFAHDSATAPPTRHQNEQKRAGTVRKTAEDFKKKSVKKGIRIG